MKETTKDTSIDKKQKRRSTKLNTNITSIESISERNEESSNSIVKNQLHQSKNNLKKRLMNSEASKPANSLNVSIKKSKRQTLDNDYNKRLNLKRRKDSKKKLDMALKRISFQQNNSLNFYNSFKTRETLKKRESIKKLDELTINNDKLNDFSSKKNINVSRSDSFVDNKYFSSKKLKYTTLSPTKTKFKGQKNMQSSNLFEKLKNSVMFEKSEKLIFRLKICYTFLSIFSLASIILEITDVILYHKKSDEYLKNKYNIISSNITEISLFKLIEEREISSQENSIRIFNLIFSLFCVFFLLLIQYIKVSFNQQSKKKKRYNYYMNYNSFFHKKKKNLSRFNNRETKDIGDHIKLILNEDTNINYEKKSEIILLIIYCIISLIFFPPKVNKIFVGKQHNIIYVYSLNSIFLIVSIFKVINIYKAVFYLFPFNNLIYKTICSSNMVKMDFKFMFKFILNMYPFSFIILNFIFIGILVSILIYCLEYFSIDVNTKLLNNKGINDLKDFYSEITLFCFFVLKSVHGNIKTNTILGSIILLIGGTLGLLISSCFIYYVNLLIEFKPEEKQAHSKLEKLLNPLNNEHKAANLIKVFLLMKKLYIDNKNIRDEYILKKENNFKGNYKNTNNFNFGMNESIDSLTNISQSNEYKDKKKFLKFLCSEFILKAKLINECKNFKNNLLIARNNSLSFNDVLKTLGEKMNANLTQLNNKIEVLIQNDQKFIGFMKFQESSLKNVRNLVRIQDNIINYLIEKNNEAELIYFRENREKQEKFLNALKNIGQNSGIPKMKSFAYGPFGFNRKFNYEKGIANTENSKDKSKNNNKLILSQNNKKMSLQKMRSSIIVNNSNLNISKVNQKLLVSRSNILVTKKPVKRIQSLDDRALIASKERKRINKLKKEIIDQVVTRKYSDKVQKRQLINKIKEKLDK